MGKPYSMDLRERVVAAVESGGLSCHAGGGQFGVGVSTAIGWMRGCARPAALRRARWAATSRRRFRASIASGCWNGSRAGLHLARAGRRTGRARAESRLPLGLGVRPRREAQLQKKPWWLANAIVPTSHGGEHSGQSIKIRIEPERLVFIDETWTKTNMAPLRGWAPRGQRLIGQGSARPLEDHDFPGGIAPRPDRGAMASRRADRWRQLPHLRREGSCSPRFGPAISSSWTISAATKATPCASSSAPPAPSSSFCRNTLPT